MFDYFTKCEIVLEYRRFSLIRNRCYTVDYVKDLEDLTWGTSQKKFAGQLNIFEKMSNYDSKRKKFGPAEIFDGAIIPTTQSYSRVPGSRGGYQRFGKGKGKAKGAIGSRQTRWVNWTENTENSQNEYNYQLSGKEGKEEYSPNEEKGESDIDWGGNRKIRG